MNRIINSLKIISASVAIALTFVFGSALLGYVSDSAQNAYAALSCSGCGGGGGLWIHLVNFDGGGGGGGGGDGGGGGGGFTPYCTLTITPGPIQSASIPPIQQFILTWSAPLATSFTINNGVGAVTPPTGGTQSVYVTGTPYNPMDPGSGSGPVIPPQYTGTAVTPYGTVTCSTPHVPPPPPAPYCTLTASPTSIAPGASSTLSWTTLNASSIYIDMGVGSVTPVAYGSTSVSPSATKTYTATVHGPGGTATCSTTITVTPPPTFCKLEITKTANKTHVAPGEEIEYTVSFKNTGSKKCTGSGVLVTDTLDSRLTYQSETHSSNITAGYLGEPVYKSSDRTIRFNAWDLDPTEEGWFKFKAVAATPTACSETVPNKARITSFEYANFTDWVESNTVNVTLSKSCHSAPVCTFTATPTSIISGSTSTLSWTTTGATSITIDQGVGAVTPVASGSTSVSPTASKTYTATVHGPGGTATCATTVTVTPPVCAALTRGAYNMYPISGPVTLALQNHGGDAGYQNGFGYYFANASGAPISGVVVWNHIQGSTGATQNITVTPPAGAAYLGFFMIRNGAGGFSDGQAVSFAGFHFSGKSSNPDNRTIYRIVGATGYYTFFSNHAVNEWGEVYETDAAGVLGNSNWDDERKGDYDYNDIMVGAIVNGVGGHGCPPPPPPAPYCTLTASPTSIAPGASSTLSWTTLNASSIYIDMGVGSVTPVAYGSTSVSPTASKTYTATVHGPGGTATCTTTITVIAPPTHCTLTISKTANKTHAAPGEEIEYTISFKNTGNAKCTGSGVLITDTLDPLLSYVSETHSTNVSAGYLGEPVYKSSDRTVRFNGWDLDPGEEGWAKIRAQVGTPSACTQSVPNVAKITSFEYSNFTNFVTSNSVVLAVTKPGCGQPAPHCTMTVNPTSVASGGTATLSWNSSNATTVTIDQGVGAVGLSGSTSVSANATKTFTGTFVGPGGTVTCNATLTVVAGPTPQCTVSVSSSSIKTGESVIVSWTSSNVTSGFITGGVGTTTSVSAGSQEIFPPSSTTFTGTFTGPHGSVSCSAPVSVAAGPGGCTGNCGGGLNQPNVTLLQKPPEAPLAFVTLDQIPYTGFEAGKALTLAFWIAVGVLAAGATYLAMGRGGFQYVLGGALAFAGVGVYEDDGEVDMPSRDMPSPFTQTRENGSYHVSTLSRNPQAGEWRSASVSAMPLAPAIPTPAPSMPSAPSIGDEIESRAYQANVLMSPDAVARAARVSSDRKTALQNFDAVLQKALALPRDGGWVMLTGERYQELAGTTSVAPTPAQIAPDVASILSSVQAVPVASHTQRAVEFPMANGDDQAVVNALAGAVLRGERENAYSIVRRLETAQANVATVMTVVAGAYDQLHRARRHGLTTELSVPGMEVSDITLCKLVETFMNGLDHSYPNPFTALKLTVAQAFEVRG